AISPASTSDPTAKSTSDTAMAENGNISRGQYTFVTRFVLLVSDTTAKRCDAAKKFQARSPQYANTGYGRPASIGATRMKIREKTAVLTSGMNIAQPTPITVCL